MKIDGLIIDGIANLENVRLDIGALNVLIAPNGYGKSNVLRAVDFGIRFIRANESERRQMLQGRFVPINSSAPGKDFSFKISGSIELEGVEWQFVYDFRCAWAINGTDGSVLFEGFKVKQPSDQRFRQMISRDAVDGCLIVPSATGRCNRHFEVSPNQLALSAIAQSSSMYLSPMAAQVYGIRVPDLETLDNPESYFSAGGGKGVSILGGMTLSEYLYRLKESDPDDYALLEDGLLQLIPGLTEFSPEMVTLPDGITKIYDIRVKEAHCIQPTSILMLSSGSKRMIFLFTLCIAARRQQIPLIMIEEPENSVHPRLIENLLLMLQNYGTDTKILFTSHSPYLMRYLRAEQMYFGLPSDDGLARFAKVIPAKLKQLYKYAGDLELTFGEFMFDFMLDAESDTSLIDKFFIR
ncbi:MAG: AAA family ATPase [Bacteroidales bacterium]|nr:AAA family ATPase [Bacteroidales bacterium]